jgi:hypothetical protein
VDPETYAIPCHSLPRVAGAQLLLLNVVGAAETQVDGPGGGSDMGVMRYAHANAKDTQSSEVVLQQFQKAMEQDQFLGKIAAKVNAFLAKLDISALAAFSKELESLPIGGATKSESP